MCSKIGLLSSFKRIVSTIYVIVNNRSLHSCPNFTASRISPRHSNKYKKTITKDMKPVGFSILWKIPSNFEKFQIDKKEADKSE